MKGKLIQTVSGFSSAFIYNSRGQLCAQAIQQNNFTFGGSVSINYLGEPFVLKITPNTKIDSSLIYSIIDKNGNSVGEIHTAVFGKFSKAYTYIKMTLFSTDYYIYEIGFGKKDGFIHYPIYKNDVQVSLIEKPTIVYNNLDEYHFYYHGEHELATLIAALFIDITQYANQGEKVKKSKRTYYVKTTNKELINKYNSSFIENT